jgi:hypothetical protein
MARATAYQEKIYNIRQISTTASSATYRRYKSHSCYEACGTFNYVTNAYCEGTIIYNHPVPFKPAALVHSNLYLLKNRNMYIFF